MYYEYLLKFITNFWNTLGEMSPYLLFGFIVAGILSIIISAEWIEKHLGRSDYKSVFKASLFGVPLPLCSCSVIPVAMSMNKHGASRGATTAFLLSTPQTGIDSIMVTYGLLGPVFGIVRPIVALITGVLGGIAVNLFKITGKISDSKSPSHEHGDHSHNDSCASGNTASSKLKSAAKHGFITLPQDINYALVAGVIISALISTLVPENFFKEKIDSTAVEMLIMLAVSIPLYVCSTGSVAIAYSFIHLGFSPGAVLVFLIAGPATNAATITTIWKILGPKNTIIYLMSVLVSSFGAGILLNKINILLESNIEHIHNHAESSFLTNPYFTGISSVILLFILFVLPIIYKRFSNEKDTCCDLSENFVLKIDNLSCSHCVNSIKKEIEGKLGVVSIDADLSKKTVTFYGKEFNKKQIFDEIKALGYSINNSD